MNDEQYTQLTLKLDEVNQSVRELTDTLREGFGLWVAGGR